MVGTVICPAPHRNLIISVYAVIHHAKGEVVHEEISSCYKNYKHLSPERYVHRTSRMDR